LGALKDENLGQGNMTNLGSTYAYKERRDPELIKNKRYDAFKEKFKDVYEEIYEKK